MTIVFIAGPRAGTTTTAHPAATRIPAPGGLYMRDDGLPIPDGHTADVAFGWVKQP
jgi:hypothetical protein